MLALVAHGSHNPHWRASVEELIQSLQSQVGKDSVRLAYMDCTPPSLLDVASEALQIGVKRLRVLPLFLTDEGHVERNITPMVDQLRNTHPTLDVEQLPPVGKHRLFKELLCSIAIQGGD